MKERIKFDLDFLKTLFFFDLAAFCAVVSYAVANIQTLTREQVYIGGVISFVLAVTLIFTTKKLLDTRKEMEEME